MFLNIFILYCLIVKCYAQSEGGSCTKDGQTGTCTILSSCPTAVEDIKHRRSPQICDVNGTDPIVCCYDNEPQSVTPSLKIGVATTTPNPTHPTTPAFEIPDYEYVDPGGVYPGCADIPAGWSTAKTGQVAFDKCIEYQEKYVYPCERTVTFSNDMVRGYHCHHDTDDLITDSLEASKHEFSHAVSVGYGETLDDVRWACRGNIISANFILTSGICGTGKGKLSFVVVGVVTPKDLMNRDNTFKVKRVIKHPNYKPPSLYNDIALLEIEKPIPLSQFIVPACLDVGGPVNDSNVLAVSWGITEKTSKQADRLQKVILQKYPVNGCTGFYTPAVQAVLGFDPQLQTCYAAMTPGRDICQGDGGGGILVKSKTLHCMYTITGVASFGRRCGNVSQPAIYTRVVAYVPWIENIVWP